MYHLANGLGSNTLSSMTMFIRFVLQDTLRGLLAQLYAGVTDAMTVKPVTSDGTRLLKGIIEVSQYWYRITVNVAAKMVSGCQQV